MGFRLLAIVHTSDFRHDCDWGEIEFSSFVNIFSNHGQDFTYAYLSVGQSSALERVRHLRKSFRYRRECIIRVESCVWLFTDNSIASLFTIDNPSSFFPSKNSSNARNRGTTLILCPSRNSCFPWPGEYWLVRSSTVRPSRELQHLVLRPQVAGACQVSGNLGIWITRILRGSMFTERLRIELMDWNIAPDWVPPLSYTEY